MKATITIIAAVLTLNTGILWAGNESSSVSIANESAMISLAPVTPAEATFEDVNVTTIDVAAIAPTMPLDAEFTDVAPDISIDLTNLAPFAPAVADFNDAVDVNINISALAPITPATADFE